MEACTVVFMAMEPPFPHSFSVINRKAKGSKMEVYLLGIEELSCAPTLSADLRGLKCIITMNEND